MNKPSRPRVKAIFITLAALIFIAQLNVAKAQTNTFPSTGNVGIGTTTPAVPLQVNVGSSTAESSAIYASGAGANRFALNVNVNGGVWSFFDYGSAGTAWYRGITQVNGNVGIGTTSPGYKLDVNGSVNAAGSFQSFNGSSTTIGFRDDDVIYRAHAFWVGNTNADGGKYAGITNYPGANTAVVNDGMFFVAPNTNNWNQWVPTLSIRGTSANGAGNVGIGTTTPNYKLDLQGGQVNASGGFCINGDCKTAWSQVGSGSSQWIGSANIYYNGGNVGIGTANPNPIYKLAVAGNINSSATITGTNIVAKYQDVAEWVPSPEKLAAGTVVVLDPNKSNQVVASTISYDTRVAGVISAQPGITLGEKSDDKVLVATTGRVRVKVDASRAPIQIGDLLVTSDVPGVAMKSEP